MSMHTVTHQYIQCLWMKLLIYLTCKKSINKCNDWF
nr:MAG TPA: Serine-rich domain associated with BRCT [Caudoviricetes sp.]